MCVHLTFNYQKATQALNFFASKEIDKKINKLKALKLVFFADRYHLRKYGRPITNDEYYAMKLGPVASGVKDIVENSVFLDEKEWAYASEFLESEKVYFRSLRDIDEDVFSQSDVEALQFAWEKFGHLDQYQLAELTHFYPEWQRHEKSLDYASRIKMSFEDFLDDPSEDVEKCFLLDESQKRDIRDHLTEMAQIEKQWAA